MAPWASAPFQVRLPPQTLLLSLPTEPEEPWPGRRAAFLDGYSLHAGTFIHENDRAGLERLCRYGARPPVRAGGEGNIHVVRPLVPGRENFAFEPTLGDGSRTELPSWGSSLFTLRHAVAPDGSAFAVAFDKGVLLIGPDGEGELDGAWCRFAGPAEHAALAMKISGDAIEIQNITDQIAEGKYTISAGSAEIDATFTTTDGIVFEGKLKYSVTSTALVIESHPDNSIGFNGSIPRLFGSWARGACH